MAAINCDDENNKAFCGGMGVQGFPTLKIVKPSKTAGKPIVEDYQGARTAAGIVDAVKAAIPNHVKRVGDKSLNDWLASNNDTTKAILFSEKGTTGALIKVLAAEFLNNLEFAQIRNKEKAATEMFGIAKYPTLIVLPGGSQEPVKFDGAFSKDAMKDFLNLYVSPASESPTKKQKAAAKDSEKKKVEDPAKSASDSSTFSKASASHASSEAFDDVIDATTIVLEDPKPTESPDPVAIPEDAPKPVVVLDLPPPISTITEEKDLQTQCLGEKTPICILALLPTTAEDKGLLLPDTYAALESLAEIADKHVQRGRKLFPFYSVPARNSGSATLRDALKLRGDDQLELVVINSRRGWWRKYQGEHYDRNSVEDWVDNIRYGEGERSKLPDGLVIRPSEEKEFTSEEELKSTPEGEPKEKPAAPKHDEL